MLSTFNALQLECRRNVKHLLITCKDLLSPLPVAVFHDFVIYVGPRILSFEGVV